MYLFMGNMRATLIPTIAVPVVILGTFAVLGLFGFSINMLTMFAMVLAIGLLVDDAIVVVENVERIMSEEGLEPKQATAKSMEQITSALIGIGLVLSAVFGPMAFFPGSTGVIYRQFSVTIIAAMLLSVLVALILTPVLCASLLKPVPAGHEPADSAVFFMRPFFRWFDRLFYRSRNLYLKLVGHSLSKETPLSVAFSPDRRGHGLSVQARCPPPIFRRKTRECSMYRPCCRPTRPWNKPRRYMDNRQDALSGDQEKEAVQSLMTVAGYSFSGYGTKRRHGICAAQGLGTAPLGRTLKVKRRGRKSHGRFFNVSVEAMVFAFPPPAVVELGQANAALIFKLLDRGGAGPCRADGKARNQLLGIGGNGSDD